MTYTFASLFTGIGLLDQGYRNAGLNHAWGIEYDPKLAEIANINIGGGVRVMNILDANPFHFDKVDVLHASPVCKSYSAANANKGEKQLDVDCALKVCEFLQVLQPKYFTLENVEAYRYTHRDGKITAFGYIIETLNSLGYWVNYSVLNANDFGVPQSRRRLVLIAVKEGFIAPLPIKEKHIGWYEAIKDLVHDLPDGKLADWQLKALPDEIKDHLLLSGTYSSFGSKDPDIRSSQTPCFTQTATMDKHPTRAILIENTGARNDRALQTRDAKEPCWTLRAMGQDGHWHRANALLSARIVALDIECLARLHSVPKDFIFSGNKALDGKGIGNGCCSLKFEKIARAVFL